MSKFKLKGQGLNDRSVWHDEDLARFYSKAGTMDRDDYSDDLAIGTWLIRTILSFGLRMSEVARVKKKGGGYTTGLMIEDCHEDIITLDGDIVQSAHIVVRAQNSKTGRPRVVSCMPEFRKRFLRHLMDSQAMGLAHYFPSFEDTARPASYKTLLRCWKIAVEYFGLPPLNPHGGRRTYATWEAARYRESIQNGATGRNFQGLDPHSLKSQLGHTTYLLTEKYYAYVPPERIYNPDPIQWPRYARL